MHAALGSTVLLLALATAQGNMYDFIDAHRQPPSNCPEGCALWSDLASDGCTRSQKDVDAKWTEGHAPAAAKRHCASPGNDPGTDGSWCYCKNSNASTYGYCLPTASRPEQLNIQLGSGDIAVVSFVTFEPVEPANAPSCSLTAEGSAKTELVEGVTHVHETPAQDRTLYLHFVKFEGLAPRAVYNYTCRSGAQNPVDSSAFTFRAPYSAGVTRLAMFGDMGVYKWNNMGNLASDCEDQKIDAVVHIGDHAYNEGLDDERRGDGYMQAYQRILARCPWFPVVGNHEYYSSEYLARYMDSTWENWKDVEKRGDRTVNTATSALGALLSRATFAGPGLTGPVPSGTSRWFSVDIGLVHLVALDLNLYFGTDSANATLKQAQIDWLKKDLAAANENREAVPWIIANSHYPLYCSECATQEMTASWYAEGFTVDDNGVEREHPPMSPKEQARIAAAREQCSKGLYCDAVWSKTVGASTATAIKDIVPVIQAAGVDLYMAGHWHYYESLYPMGTPPEGTGGPPTQKNFVNPTSTVHITTGNGGPPGKDTMNTPMPALRNKSDKYGYGRVTAYNATHLLFEQVLNGYSDEGEPGEVFDSFVVQQDKHGPFNAL